MFFDIILLNTNHGRFGVAWLAATRGPKCISKTRVRETNICKLCEDMERFIITNAASPTKRFSLRLSAILLNGTIKILREQVKMLENDIISFITTIRRPLIIVFDTTRGTDLFETPPTPVAKVKRKRARKQIVDTPDIAVDVANLLIQLPNLEDVLLPPARVDDICIREDMGRRLELLDDGFGLGVLTGNEYDEQMNILFSSTQMIPAIQPEIESISDPGPPQCLVEVVAQVHAPRDGINEDENVVPRPPQPEPADTLQATQVHAPQDGISLGEHVVPRPPQSEPADAFRAAEIARPPLAVLQEIPPADQVPTITGQTPAEVQAADKGNEKVNNRGESAEVLAELLRDNVLEQDMTPTRPGVKGRPGKMALERSRLLLKIIRGRFVRINRYMENEGEFINEAVPLSDIAFRNISVNSRNLYEMYWHDDDEPENIVAIRGDLRSISTEDSVGMRRTDISSKRLTTEEISNSEGGITKPSVSLGPQERDSVHSVQRQLLVEEPAVPLSSPRKRKRTTATLNEEVSDIQVEVVPQKPKRKPKIAHAELIDNIQTHVPVELTMEVPQPQLELESVQEQLASIVVEHAASVVPLPAEPTASDFKVRQQAIVGIVARSTCSLTIEEICEKPINRLHIARAFLDLIVLAGKQFIVLKSEDDSLELKSIEKGPKLLSR